MLEIVLFIGKTAGIIVISILGILIVLTSSVLFVPVRYRGDVAAMGAEDGGKKAVCAKFRAAWLFRLVQVHAVYEESFRVRVKLLFFTLFDTAKAEKPGREKKGKRKKGRGTGSAKRNPEDAGKNGAGMSAEDGGTVPEGVRSGAETACGGGKTGSPAGGNASGDGPDDGMKGDAGSGKKRRGRGRSAKKEKKAKKFRNFNILQTIRDFCDRLRGIRERAEEIEAFWKASHVVRAKGLAWAELLYLLRHTKPRQISGYLRFGFGDPSLTGYCMAAYGILRPVWSPKVSVEPDFENEVLACHVEIKGKARAWHFAWAAARMFFSKDVRRTVKDAKRLLKSK